MGTPTTGIRLVTPDAISNETHTTYAAAGRVSTEILSGRNPSTGNQLEELSRTTHNYTGETITVNPPSGDVLTASQVDARGRIILNRRYPNGPGSNPIDYSYEYDHAGNLEQVSDEAGNTWRYSYDTMGRRLTSSDPDAGVSAATYDDLGRQLTSTLDPNGTPVVSMYDYDNLGRKTAEYLGAGASRQQTYGWTFDTTTGGKDLPTTNNIFHNGMLLYKETVQGYTNGRATGTTAKFEATTNLVPSTLANAYPVTTTHFQDGSLQSQGPATIGDLPAESIDRTYDTVGRVDAVAGWGSYVRGTR